MSEHRPIGALLTVPEVAERLRRDASTVRRMIRRGELAASKPGGGRFLIEEAAIAELLKRSRVQPVAPAPRAHRPDRQPVLPSNVSLPPGGSFRSRRKKAH
jgi:excisionase family DNA binding protein